LKRKCSLKGQRGRLLLPENIRIEGLFLACKHLLDIFPPKKATFYKNINKLINKRERKRERERGIEFISRGENRILE
jgi:hypothetical protein